MKPKITFYKIKEKLIVEVPSSDDKLPPEVITMTALSGGWDYQPPRSGIARSLPTGKWLITEDPSGYSRRNYFGLFLRDDKVNDQFKHYGIWRNGIRLGFHEDSGSHGCIMTRPGKGEDSSAARQKWARIQEIVRATLPMAIRYVNDSDPNRSDPTPRALKAYFDLEVKL